MGVRHRESTPAGLLLIGYFSFLLLCYCHNFFFYPSLNCFLFVSFPFLLLFHCFHSIPAMVSHSLFFPLSLSPSWSFISTLFFYCSLNVTSGISHLSSSDSVPSFTFFFYNVVQPFYSAILRSRSCDCDPDNPYYWLLVTFKPILMGAPGYEHRATEVSHLKTEIDLPLLAHHCAFHLHSSFITAWVSRNYP